MMRMRPVRPQPVRFTPLRALVWLTVAAASVSLLVIGILGMIVKG